MGDTNAVHKINTDSINIIQSVGRHRAPLQISKDLLVCVLWLRPFFVCLSSYLKKNVISQMLKLEFEQK